MVETRPMVHVEGPDAGPYDAEVLLIGGRSGVGKSTLGWEVSRQLQEAGAAHCHIEGDIRTCKTDLHCYSRP